MVVLALVQHEARRGVTGQQTIEVLELAPLAFPRHPDPFARIETARAVQHVERLRFVFLVETPNVANERRQDAFVGGLVLASVTVAAAAVASPREEARRRKDGLAEVWPPYAGTQTGP